SRGVDRIGIYLIGRLIAALSAALVNGANKVAFRAARCKTRFFILSIIIDFISGGDDDDYWQWQWQHCYHQQYQSTASFIWWPRVASDLLARARPHLQTMASSLVER